MAFKNKDLLVSVLPQLGMKAEEYAKICIWRTTICRFPTFPCLRPWTGWCGRCSLLMTEIGCGLGGRTICPGGSIICDPTIFCPGGSDPFIIEHLEDIVQLRSELKETLAQLDQLEKSGVASGIQSRAEADALERDLTERLEHVRAMKKNLK